MSVFRNIVVWVLVLALPALVLGREGEFKYHLDVPKQVADHAARRVAGDAQAPPPILMLQGLETGANESLTIHVLGESLVVGKSGPELAVTGLVGSPDATERSLPLQKTNLPVPLNDDAAKLLAGRSEITLILHVESNKTPRKNLKIDRVFFQVPQSR
jgi:hypothetical protein